MPLYDSPFQYNTRPFYEGLAPPNSYNKWIRIQIKRLDWIEGEHYEIKKRQDGPTKPYLDYWVTASALIQLSEHYFYTAIGKTNYHTLTCAFASA